MQLQGFELDPERLPKHIGIIMDGNGRWAKSHGKRRVAGHQKGLETLKELIRFNRELKVPILSVYAFSTENWKRPKEEVDFLMSVAKDFIKSYLNELDKNGVRLIISGTFEGLDEELIQIIQESVKKTCKNRDFIFNIAFNYGGRKEIIDASLRIARDLQNNRLNEADLSEEKFRNYLYHPEIPDIDLLIRTSGEMRISNFMLWQIAYSEIKIFDKYWPDFTSKDLCKAVFDYQNRERRFGNV